MYFNYNILFEISSYLTREQFHYFNSIIKSDGSNIKRQINNYNNYSNISHEYIYNRHIEDGKFIAINYNFKIIRNSINGFSNGKVSIYDRNTNKILEEYYHDNGIIIGKCYNYHDNGKISISSNYDNGLKEGAENFYDKEGNIQRTITFRAGVIYGKIIIYYPNGVKRIILEKYGGIYNGKFIIFYQNGNKRVVANILGSEPYDFNGKYQEFYENGKLKTDSFFISRNRQGESIQYNKEGEIELKGYYFNGDKINGDDVFLEFLQSPQEEVLIINDNIFEINELNNISNNIGILDDLEEIEEID